MNLGGQAGEAMKRFTEALFTERFVNPICDEAPPDLVYVFEVVTMLLPLTLSAAGTSSCKTS
jgi:hypothetical protein